MNYFYFEDPSHQIVRQPETPDAIQTDYGDSTLWKEYKQIGSICLGVSAIIVISFVVQIIVAIAMEALYPAWQEDASALILLSTLPMYLCAMPLSLLLFRAGKSTPPMPRRRLPDR